VVGWMFFCFTFYRILGSENYWMSSGLLSIPKKAGQTEKEGPFNET